MAAIAPTAGRARQPTQPAMTISPAPDSALRTRPPANGSIPNTASGAARISGQPGGWVRNAAPKTVAYPCPANRLRPRPTYFASSKLSKNGPPRVIRARNRIAANAIAICAACRSEPPRPSIAAESTRRRRGFGRPSIPGVSAPIGSRRAVAIVVHAYFEEHARVRRKAEALVADGRPVDVFALRLPGDEPVVERDGIRIHHLPVGRHQGAGIATYVKEYLAFLFRAGIALTRAYRGRRFGLVDINSLPDFLVFAALPLRILGVPVVLDLHEAMPEFFTSRFPGASNPIALAALRFQE